MKPREETCWHCGGTGLVSVPANQQLTVLCEACGWKGRRYRFMDKPCPRCGRHEVKETGE